MIKLKSTLKKIELNKCNTNLMSLKLKHKDIVSLIYYSLENGSLQFHSFSGQCLGFRRNGLSTKLKILGYVKPVNVKQFFFVNSPVVLDIKLIKSK